MAQKTNEYYGITQLIQEANRLWDYICANPDNTSYIIPTTKEDEPAIETPEPLPIPEEIPDKNEDLTVKGQEGRLSKEDFNVLLPIIYMLINYNKNFSECNKMAFSPQIIDEMPHNSEEYKIIKGILDNVNKLAERSPSKKILSKDYPAKVKSYNLDLENPTDWRKYIKKVEVIEEKWTLFCKQRMMQHGKI